MRVGSGESIDVRARAEITVDGKLYTWDGPLDALEMDRAPVEYDVGDAWLHHAPGPFTTLSLTFIEAETTRTAAPDRERVVAALRASDEVERGSCSDYCGPDRYHAIETFRELAAWYIEERTQDDGAGL